MQTEDLHATIMPTWHSPQSRHLRSPKVKSNLKKLKWNWSRELSVVRIHVERVIGVLKQKYTILQGVLPLSIVADKDEEYASVDKLVRVCCALVNLCPSVVPQD